MTEPEIKNQKIIKLNISKSNFNKFFQAIKLYYNINCPNIAEVYIDKIYELEEYFKSYNLSFYSNNILGSIILEKFDSILADSAYTLVKTGIYVRKNKNHKQLRELLVTKIGILDYLSFYYELLDFSLNNIDNLIINYFSTYCYSTYTINEPYIKYEEVRQILNKFGISTDKLDKKVKPVIKKRVKEFQKLMTFIQKKYNLSDEELKKSISSIFVELIDESNQKKLK